ncbi:hypothetical protein [Arthrobacter sp. Z4-13]
MRMVEASPWQYLLWVYSALIAMPAPICGQQASRTSLIRSTLHLGWVTHPETLELPAEPDRSCTTS